jgi:type IX secretion system substrate protein
MKCVKLKYLKTILLFVGVICSLPLNAQYSFRHFKDEYKPLDKDSSINITENIAWDNLGDYYDIPLGFNFELNGVMYDSVRISPEGGQINFFQECGYNVFHSGPMINAFYTWLYDKGSDTIPSTPRSPILYRTTGNTSSKLTIVEWRNAGISGGVSFDDYIDFQVWFYESSNQIEIRYGGGYVEDTANSWIFIGGEGPGVSFPYIVDCNPIVARKDILIFGYRNNPKDTIVDSTNFPTDLYYYHITGIPDEGMVYQFNPWPVGIEGIEAMDDIQVFPNPATEQIQIKTEIPEMQNSRFAILNMMGAELTNGRLAVGGQIDVSSLTPGIYLLYVKVKDRVIVKKFSKL